MKLTMKELKELGDRARSRAPEYPGTYKIDPPLELVCREDGASPLSGNLTFRKGEVVHTNEFEDETSHHYPGTLHLVEKGFWWPVDMFEVKK